MDEKNAQTPGTADAHPIKFVMVCVGLFVSVAILSGFSTPTKPAQSVPAELFPKAETVQQTPDQTGAKLATNEVSRKACDKTAEQIASKEWSFAQVPKEDVRRAARNLCLIFEQEFLVRALSIQSSVPGTIWRGCEARVAKSANPSFEGMMNCLDAALDIMPADGLPSGTTTHSNKGIERRHWTFEDCRHFQVPNGGVCIIH